VTHSSQITLGGLFIISEIDVADIQYDIFCTCNTEQVLPK